MKKVYFLGLGILMSLLYACQSEEAVQLPSETAYVFPFKSEVDANNLGCGYNRYEDCGDWIKKRVRGKVAYLSAKELIELGDRFHEEHFAYSLTNHSKASWVKEIIERMKPFLVENEFPYNAYIVNRSDFNAFTIPGGNIYITTGLLDAVPTKEALAYIIGHELGHNENDHTKELARLHTYTKQLRQEGGILSLGRAIATNFTANICGKSDELECDISAIYLLYKAGYDPEKALGGIELLREFSTPKPDSRWEQLILTFISSHPWSEDRDKCVRSYVRRAKVTAKCAEIYENQQGQVITKRSPLNIRAYPIKGATKLAKIPKGAFVKVLCTCVEQTYRKREGWLFVQYDTGETIFTGWVDKQYIRFG